MNTILGFSPWEILRRGGGIGTETGIRFVGHVCDEADDDEGELYGDEELQQSIRRFYGIASDDNNYDDRGKDFRSSSDTVVGEAQKVIKRSRVELLALTDLREWQSLTSSCLGNTPHISMITWGEGDLTDTVDLLHSALAAVSFFGESILFILSGTDLVFSSDTEVNSSTVATGSCLFPVVSYLPPHLSFFVLIVILY